MRSDNSYSWDDYGNDIIKASMPWVAFAALAFGIFILAVVIKCISCMCCKNRVKHRGDFIRNLCVFLSFLVTFLGLTCCAFIIHFSDSFYQGYQQVQCSAGRIPYVLGKGNLNFKWMGLDSASDNITYMRDFIKNNYTECTNQLWENTDWILNMPANFYTLTFDYYNDYRTLQVPNPNFNNNTDIMLSYISNLGPPGFASTNIGLISEEYNNTFEEVTFIFVALKVGTLAIEQETGSVLIGLNEAQKDVKTFKDGNNDVKDQIDNWIVDNKDNAMQGWRAFTMGIILWGWFICIGVLLTVSAQALNKPNMASGLCFFWIFAGIFSLIGFVACIFLISIGIVSEDSCGLLEELFTEKGLKEYTEVIPSDISDYMNACLNENGNIDKYFNLNETLSAFNATYKYYNELLTLPINEEMKNFTSITENQEMINSLLTFINIEAPDVSIQDTSSYNLNELNKYTNNYTEESYQVNCTGSSSDLWVFISSNCGSYKYINSNITNENFGKMSCLVIFEWSESSVDSRYNGSLTCPKENFLDNLIKTQQALLNFGKGVASVFTKLNSSFPQFQDSVNEYVNNLIPLNNNTINYFNDDNQLGPFYKMIYGPDGILNALNCSFAHPYSRTIHKAVCTNSVQSMYQIFVYIFILSFLMLALEIINLYLSKALMRRDESIVN